MQFTEKFKQEQFEFGWWVEIVTVQPQCTYYFGPFFTTQEAQWFVPGYAEDLKQEGCQEILIQIKQCQPKEITIFEKEWEETA